MYCLGERRSAIFSPRASRSRSRWRICSRSSATDFIRLESVSVASSGMASVSTVAIAATAENTIASRRGLETASIRMSSMASHQKSKLIILRMTITPMNIQIAEAASIMRPSDSVHSSSM